MSSSESETEQDDFLYPNANLEGSEFADFNPRKRRRTGRDAKESAALGIFGSESEDEGPGKRWKSKSLRSKGMSFVSSGKTNKDEEEEDDDVDVEDEYPQGGEGKFEAPGAAYPEDEHAVMDDVGENQTAGLRAGLGSGLGSGAGLGARSQPQQSFRSGLGRRSSAGMGWQSPAASKQGLGASSYGGAAPSPLGMGFRPSSEDTRILEDDDDLEAVPVKRQAMPSAFSTPTNSRGGKPAKGKGNGTPINAGSFAARMMAKMGYKEGEGLGKDGTGRSGVIEVTLRPQGVGLGAVKEKSKQEREEERRQAAIKGEIIEDSEEEERKKRKVRRAKAMGAGSGTGSGNNTPKRKLKTKYQSLPEMMRAAPGLNIPDAFTPILDMTGPGQKYLTSSSGLVTPTALVPESTEIVEARKLARRAQNDLSSFVEEWKGLEERKAYVDLQMAQQRQTIEAQKSATEQLRMAEEAVQGLSTAVKNAQWDPVIEALTKLEGLEVADTDELASIAVAAVHPFLRQAVEGWQPLDDPKLSGVASDGFASALSKIQHLLGTSTSPAQNSVALQSLSLNHTKGGRSHKTTPYESLIYTVWFPKVRSAITNTWDALNPSPLLTLLDTWISLLPAFVKTQIIDHLLVRKLDEAIQAWNPKRKSSKTSQLPHLWLFPWLPYLPAHHLDSKASSGLLADVKRKFRTLIDSWDFRRGIIPGLTQWRDLLQSSRDDSWTPLMLNHALPGLAKYFRTNFQVAPQDQEPYMKVLTNVFEWRDVLGDQLLGQLLVDEFFPMWMDVLHQWLTMEGVNYAEIGEWFDFWRGVFPSEINERPEVKAMWKKGNDLINAALDLGDKAATDLPAPSKPSKEETRASSRAAAPETPLPATSTVPEAQEVSFRHEVEDWCMARDLQFIAEKSQLEAGGPVYRITASVSGRGGVLIYLKNDAVYAQIKRGSWTRLGGEMDALFELAHR